MNNYIPITEKEKQEMLDFIGVSDVDELFKVIPAEAKLSELKLPEGMSELETEKYFDSFYAPNTPIIFAGGGVADHWVPSAVDAIVNRGEFYTAYTPYQAEVSQGTLQTIYEYQSFIVNLTGMEISNASMYDGPTALAEAILMLFRIHKKKNKVLLASNIYRNWKEVIRTYFSGMAFNIQEVKVDSAGKIDLSDLESKIDSDVAGFV
jgi:glycine dehydrogenase subunit 1